MENKTVRPARMCLFIERNRPATVKRKEIPDEKIDPQHYAYVGMHRFDNGDDPELRLLRKENEGNKNEP